MHKKQWMDEITREIIRTANTLNEENAEQGVQNLRHYITIWEALRQLPDKDTKDSGRDPGEIRESRDEANQVYIGQFQRQLSGGTLGSFRIFVPESVVRNLRLAQGDWVRAKAMKSIVVKHGMLRTLYDYSVVRKEEGEEESDRMTLPLCRVKYDPYEDTFFLDTKGLGRIAIGDHDVSQLDLEEGDRVDYAYRRGEPARGRVVWKYRLPSDPVELQEPDRPVDALQAEGFFADRSLVIVGVMKEALKMQGEVEEYGGLVSFLTGDERFDIMERIGTSCDTVVVILDALTPHGLNKISDIGKKYALPMLFTRDRSPEEMVQLLLENRGTVPGEAVDGS